LIGFFAPLRLVGFHGRNVERIFGDCKLQWCSLKGSPRLAIQHNTVLKSDGSVLRSSKGFGWFQSVYNNIVPFHLLNEDKVLSGSSLPCGLTGRKPTNHSPRRVGLAEWAWVSLPIGTLGMVKTLCGAGPD